MFKFSAPILVLLVATVAAAQPPGPPIPPEIVEPTIVLGDAYRLDEQDSTYICIDVRFRCTDPNGATVEMWWKNDAGVWVKMHEEIVDAASPGAVGMSSQTSPARTGDVDVKIVFRNNTDGQQTHKIRSIKPE